MKNLGYNLFLFSILITVLVLPIGSFKTVKLESSVLSENDTNIEYLEETIYKQKERIEQLIQENNSLKEELKILSK